MDECTQAPQLFNSSYLILIVMLVIAVKTVLHWDMNK